MLKFLRRLFCKHEYRWQVKGGYMVLGCQDYLYRCPKCGKVKETRTEYYE